MPVEGFEEDFLQHCCQQLRNGECHAHAKSGLNISETVPGINRIVYYITSKTPGASKLVTFGLGLTVG